MIDVSPLLLWTADDILELMPVDSADSPQARRLAVLVAEAQSAGQGAAVLAWLCDAARVLSLDLPLSPGRVALERAIVAIDNVLIEGERLESEQRAWLVALCELETPRDSAEAIASALAGWALSTWDQAPLVAEQAWQTATELLAAIARAAGDAADPAIARCAELAYRRLFAAVTQP